MIDLLPHLLALCLAVGIFIAWRKGLLPGWAAVLIAAVATVGALLLRRPPTVPPAPPPPAPPSREVVSTGAAIVREQADRQREAIADAGTDVDKLADIGRGQR